MLILYAYLKNGFTPFAICLILCSPDYMASLATIKILYMIRGLTALFISGTLVKRLLSPEEILFMKQLIRRLS